MIRLWFVILDVAETHRSLGMYRVRLLTGKDQACSPQIVCPGLDSMIPMA
jgi:hypothetical protein